MHTLRGIPPPAYPTGRSKPMLAGFFVGRGPSYNLSNCKPADAACKGKACLPYNLSVCFADSSPSRGALGITMQFVLLTAAAWHTTETKRSGTPEAPLLGELLSGAKLRGCTETRPTS